MKHAKHGRMAARVWRKRAARTWAAALCLAALCPKAQAQQAKAGEYDVKAAYLFNFSKFVRWPEETAEKAESFSICVLGQDPFGRSLDAAVNTAAAKSKTVGVKRITRPQESGSCQILFISSSETKQLKDILPALGNGRVLTVSDIPQFSRLGGMIEFVLVGDKVRFEVNLSAAESAGLVLSSELLKVATTVRKNSSAGD